MYIGVLKLRIFNTRGWYARPKHVAHIDVTSKNSGVVDGSTLSIFDTTNYNGKNSKKIQKLKFLLRGTN
jgi:hypothetical protein